jgi:hypothetical protein
MLKKIYQNRLSNDWRFMDFWALPNGPRFEEHFLFLSSQRIPLLSLRGYQTNRKQSSSSTIPAQANNLSR